MFEVPETEKLDNVGEKRGLLHDPNYREPWYHPTRAAYRFTIMTLACLMCSGVYTSYDSIGAISPYLHAGMEVTDHEYSSLVAIYALPNVVLAFLGGILTDRIGYNKASILFSCFVVLGNVVIAAGAGDYHTMLAGRFIFGLGGESLIVSQTTILTKWFTNKELGLSFGFSLSAGMFGSVVALWTLPTIAENYGYESAFWFSAGMCVLSFACTLLLIFMDMYASIVTKEEEIKVLVNESQTVLFNIIILNYEPFSWKLFDVRGMPLSYWLTVIICLCFYAAMVFTTYCTDFLYTDHGYDEGSAAKVTSIIYTAATIISPFIGWFVDAYGLRSHLLTLGSVIMVPAFLFMAILPGDPIFWIVLLGIAYSVVPSVLWTIIPLVVEEKMVGRAFGLSYSLYDGVIFTVPLIFGVIHESTGEYTDAILLFCLFATIGSILCVPLWIYDKRNSGSALRQPSPGAVTLGMLWERLRAKFV